MPGNKPKTLSRKETEFLLKKRTRNGSATYAAVEHEHTEYDEVATPEDYNAVGNGTTDDTNAITSLVQSGKLIFLPNKNYATPGTVTAFTHPTIILADDASESGTKLPFITVTTENINFKSIGRANIWAYQDNAYRNDEVMVHIQRYDTVDSGYTNPSALRVFAKKEHSNDSTLWGISAILENYSTVASTGDTAISSTNRKYGTSNSFGGSFNNLDYNKFATVNAVTAIVGSEFNMRVVGLDHPSQNYGYGLRRNIDVLANTNTNVTDWSVNDGTNYGDGEVGTGIAVHSGGITNGYFRYGIAIFEEAGNPNPITTGMEINTTGPVGLSLAGANSTAQINLAGTTPIGINLAGTYSGGAIKLGSGDFIAWEVGGTIRTGYENSVSRWRVMAGANERFGVDSGTGDLFVRAVKVIGARDTGWTADTGTAKKTANATYSGTASVGYVQAEMQAIMNAVRDATQTIKALKDASITHGFIGT